MNEPPMCQRCETEYNLRDGQEPSKYCDYCAQELVVEMEEKLKKESKMSDKISEILAERGKQYGSFEGHARLTQTLKAVFYDHMENLNPNFKPSNLSNIEREGLDMIFHKLGRIGNGNPHYSDNFADIAGYASLVADVQEQQEHFGKGKTSAELNKQEQDMQAVVQHNKETDQDKFRALFNRDKV